MGGGNIHRVLHNGDDDCDDDYDDDFDEGSYHHPDQKYDFE